MIAPSQQCSLCQHFQGAVDRSRAGQHDGKEILACRAFPEGIPDDITDERFDHRRAHRGDRDVRFTPVHPAANAIVEELFDRRKP